MEYDGFVHVNCSHSGRASRRQHHLDIEVHLVCSRGSALERQVLMLRTAGLLLERNADPHDASFSKTSLNPSKTLPCSHHPSKPQTSSGDQTLEAPACDWGQSSAR